MSEGAKGVQISAQAKGKTRDELAKVAGVSHDTIHKVEKIETKKNGITIYSYGCPELLRQLRLVVKLALYSQVRNAVGSAKSITYYTLIAKSI